MPEVDPAAGEGVSVVLCAVRGRSSSKSCPLLLARLVWNGEGRNGAKEGGWR